MDAPCTATRNQGYAAACGVPNPTTCINPFGSQYDPDLQDSALCHFIDPAPSIYSSQCFVDNLYNGSCNASVHALQKLPAKACESDHTQTKCKLQPRHVFNASLACTPPPSAHITQLQSMPTQPLPADMVAPLILPPHHDSGTGPFTTPCTLPTSHPVFHIVDAGPSLIGTLSIMPSPFVAADQASYVRSSSMPSYQPPPASLRDNPCKFDAGPNFVGCMGNQLRVPHEKFTSGRSHMELNDKDQHLYNVFNDGSKLTSPVQNHSTFKNPMKLGLPILLDVPTSPTTYYGTSIPTSHAPYTQSSTFHVQAAMEMSNTVSAPAALVTSNSSSYWTSTPPEGRSHTTPASPTPSVNKGARRRSGASDYGSTDGGSVTFKVKTHMLNLNDGYVWKKYGEKKIKLHKFTRSYFWCDKKDRCGCEVTKRTQRCNEDDYVLFTYLGKHNHYL